MNEIVASFQKNKYEEVRFQIKEYKGKDLIDIRIWTDVKGADHSSWRTGIGSEPLSTTTG